MGDGTAETDALLDACYVGNLALIREYVCKGMPVTFANDDVTPEFSPLHASVSMGHFEAVKLLIELGASAAEYSIEGENSLLHLVAEEEFAEIAEYLLSRGADKNINRTDYVSRSPLMISAAKGNMAMCSLFLSFGAFVDYRNVSLNGNTALAEASESGAIEMIDFLIERGADPFVPGFMSNTAWSRAKDDLTRNALKKFSLYCECLIDPRNGLALDKPDAVHHNSAG